MRSADEEKDQENEAALSETSGNNTDENVIESEVIQSKRVRGGEAKPPLID
jgi:hypothetical protein